MFRDVLSQGGKAKLDLAAVDAMVAGIPEEGRGNMLHLVGRFLRLHGDPETARTYLRRCADSPSAYFWYRAIAADLARKGKP